MKLIYNVKDKPKFPQLIVFAFQQLLAIMAATLVVPVIVGNGMQPAAALLGAGVGTFVYLLFTKFRSPVFLGSSFAFLGSMAAAFAGASSVSLGYLGLIIGAVLAGLVYVIIAAIVKFVGVEWINKLMPAVVIGPTVAIIGMSLAGNAVGDLSKTNYVTVLDPNDYQIVSSYDAFGTSEDNLKTDSDSVVYYAADKNVDLEKSSIGDVIDKNITVKANDDGSFTLTENKGSPFVSLICGLITLLVTISVSTYAKKFFKLIPFIIGICSGYLAASVFYAVGAVADIPSLMIIDYSPLTNLFANGVTLSSFVTVPEFTFIKALGGFPELNLTYITTVAVAYVPVAFVVFAEHIADHKNISAIIESDLLEDPGLHRTLLGDGVGSMTGAILGGCPNTTYGESVGCVAITGNASVVTILTASIGAILISFIAPFVAFVNSIPSAVMGGVCVALYGFIAVSGLKMIQKIDLEKNKNLFVVSAILIAGVGGLSVTFGKISLTSIACALILGIIVNIMLSKAKE